MATTDNAKMQTIEAEVVTTHQALTDTLKKYERTASDAKDKELLKGDLDKLVSMTKWAVTYSLSL